MLAIAELQDAISKADSGDFYVPDVEGYTSPKCQRLLNLLGAQSSHYLEIGTHKGACFIPCLYGNQALKGTVIDNWSLSGNHRPAFEANCAAHIPHADMLIIEQDCFTVDLKAITPAVDLYFFDGYHDRRSQYLALTYFAPVLADEFIFLVDDYNWAEPREETEPARRQKRS
jgi:hypothetical protein